jgi:predicted Zn finger-like uncharacterized protein
MILQCSECQARYLVPDGAIGAEGRTVRCARCMYTWFQAPAPAAEPGAPLADLAEVLDEINAKPKPIPPGSNLPVIRHEKVPLGLRLSVVAMAAIAAALLVLLIHPALLLLPPSTGLMLADVGITKLAVDNHLVYEINGKITNTSTDPMVVPNLRITLLGEHNIKLRAWEFSGNGKMLAPGRDIPFTTGNLEVPAGKAARFSVDLGNSFELALRQNR